MVLVGTEYRESSKKIIQNIFSHEVPMFFTHIILCWFNKNEFVNQKYIFKKLKKIYDPSGIGTYRLRAGLCFDNSQTVFFFNY